MAAPLPSRLEMAQLIIQALYNLPGPAAANDPRVVRMERRNRTDVLQSRYAMAQAALASVKLRASMVGDDHAFPAILSGAPVQSLPAALNVPSYDTVLRLPGSVADAVRDVLQEVLAMPAFTCNRAAVLAAIAQINADELTRAACRAIDNANDAAYRASE